jgi:hypothetical protein
MQKEILFKEEIVTRYFKGSLDSELLLPHCCRKDAVVQNEEKYLPLPPPINGSILKTRKPLTVTLCEERFRGFLEAQECVPLAWIQGLRFWDGGDAGSKDATDGVW